MKAKSIAGPWKRSVPAMLSLTLCVAGGCSEQKRHADTDWYEPSRTRNEAREAYVDEQAAFGVSEADAKRKFDAERVIEKTRGYHAISVSGDDVSGLGGGQ